MSFHEMWVRQRWYGDETANIFDRDIDGFRGRYQCLFHEVHGGLRGLRQGRPSSCDQTDNFGRPRGHS